MALVPSVFPVQQPAPAPPQPNPQEDFSAVGPDPFADATAGIPDFIGDAGPEAEGATAAPDGDVLSPDIPPELIKQALGTTFESVFAMIAKARGNHWQLSASERGGMVGVWTPIVQVMLQKVGGENPLLIVACMTTTAVIGGKLAYEATHPDSRTVNIRTEESGASSVSSASAAAAKPTAQSSSSESAFA